MAKNTNKNKTLIIYILNGPNTNLLGDRFLADSDALAPIFTALSRRKAAEKPPS